MGSGVGIDVGILEGSKVEIVGKAVGMKVGFAVGFVGLAVGHLDGHRGGNFESHFIGVNFVVTTIPKVHRNIHHFKSS